MHALVFVGRFVARDAVKGVAAAGVVKHLGIETVGQQPAQSRVATTGLTGAEEPAKAQLGSRLAGERGTLFDQVLTKGRRGDQRIGSGQVGKVEHALRTPLDADRDHAGTEVLYALR